VRLWNVVAEKEEQRFVGYRIGNAMAFSPDGRTIVTNHGSANLLIWDVATGALVDSIVASIWPEQLLYSSGGDSLIALTADRIEIYSIPEHRKVGTIGSVLFGSTSWAGIFDVPVQPARLLPNGNSLMI
jgi:WD40 repeat protein